MKANIKWKAGHNAHNVGQIVNRTGQTTYSHACNSLPTVGDITNFDPNRYAVGTLWNVKQQLGEVRAYDASAHKQVATATSLPSFRTNVSGTRLIPVGTIAMCTGIVYSDETTSDKKHIRLKRVTFVVDGLRAIIQSLDVLELITN